MILALLLLRRVFGLRGLTAGQLFSACASLHLIAVLPDLAFGLSAHNCKVIAASLPDAGMAKNSSKNTVEKHSMLATVLSNLHQETGSDALIKSGERYYFTSQIMARAMGAGDRKSILIFSLKELEQWQPGKHAGAQLIFAGSYDQAGYQDAPRVGRYLANRFRQNGWSLSFMLGKSWQDNLDSPQVTILRHLAKVTGGHGLTFFKRDVAACIRGMRPKPTFAIQEGRKRIAPPMRDRLIKALSDPDFRTL